MEKVQCPCGKILKVTALSRIGRTKYCSKVCLYKFKKRPSGLKYKIVVKNKGWFKKGSSGFTGKHSEETKIYFSKIRKGKRVSPDTEFKYTNGLGYRHLLFKGILTNKCSKCNERNINRLHVHHMDKNRLNNSIDNLLVLCRPHHLAEHGKKERVYVEGRKAI